MAPRRTLLSLTLASSFGLLGCGSNAPAAGTASTRAPRTAAERTGVPGDPRPGHAPAVAGSTMAPVPPNTWVLHIGDSFVHASLQQNLGPRVRATGSSYVVDATTATYTTTWASDPELGKWLGHRPSLVLVTLGANEVEMPTPGEHAGAVERLAHRIAASGASCVWMSPPMWKADTGILGVIHDHCAPCLFFDSDAVLGGLEDAERQRDRIHPNERGGARWASVFWDWLLAHRDATRDGWALVPYETRYR